jgi:hypothetical protein
MVEAGLWKPVMHVEEKLDGTRQEWEPAMRVHGASHARGRGLGHDWADVKLAGAGRSIERRRSSWACPRMPAQGAARQTGPGRSRTGPREARRGRGGRSRMGRGSRKSAHPGGRGSRPGRLQPERRPSRPVGSRLGRSRNRPREPEVGPVCGSSVFFFSSYLLRRSVFS